MSIYRESDAPAIDRTQVETAKIREAGETKRKLIAERELTRRTSIENRDTSGYIFPRFFAALVVLAVVLASVTVANTYLEGKYPKAVVCEETSEVINSNHPKRSCPGGRIETEAVKDHDSVLVRCRCPGPAASAQPAVQ